MNCYQKLCQRTKNLNVSGTCNVCEEVIKENKKEHEKIEKKSVIGMVDIDINTCYKSIINAQKEKEWILK